MSPRIAAFALFAVTLVPSVAKAWTEANVSSLQAAVEVARDGRAQVGLHLTVQVRGGWLEGLEIAGLDPNLEIDATKPPTLVDEHGEKHDTEFQARPDGRVFLRFTGHRSPRRGTYTVDLVYRTLLGGDHFIALGDGNVEFHWTLPGWRAGLDGVQIALTVPGNAEVIAADEGDELIEHDRFEGRDTTTFTWRRVHLPLTTSWQLATSIPEDALAENLRGGAPMLRPEPVPEPPRVARIPVGMILAAALVLIALTKRALFVRACREADVRRRSFVPLPGETLRWLAILGAGAAASYADLHEQSLFAIAGLGVIVLLTVERGTRRSAADRQVGTWRPATEDDLRVARADRRHRRWLGPSVFDLSRPGGWPLFLMSVGGASALAWRTGELTLTIQGGLLLTMLFLGTTRHQLPRSPQELLLELRRLLRRAPSRPRAALMIGEHEGRWLDSRLRFDVEPSIEGLVHCDLLLGQRCSLGGYHLEPHVLVVTTQNSIAEDRLRAIVPHLGTDELPNGHRARAWPASDDPQAEIDWLVRETRGALEAADTIFDLDPPAQPKHSVTEIRT